MFGFSADHTHVFCWLA